MILYIPVYFEYWKMTNKFFSPPYRDHTYLIYLFNLLKAHVLNAEGEINYVRTKF